jgi:hypothetical protein
MKKQSGQKVQINIPNGPTVLSGFCNPIELKTSTSSPTKAKTEAFNKFEKEFGLTYLENKDSIQNSFINSKKRQIEKIRHKDLLYKPKGK